jgi:hypothetical protein
VDRRKDFTRADFDAARANSVSTAGVITTDVAGVGDAAYTQVPPGTNPSGVLALIVLSGACRWRSSRTRRPINSSGWRRPS